MLKPLAVEHGLLDGALDLELLGLVAVDGVLHLVQLLRQVQLAQHHVRGQARGRA